MPKRTPKERQNRLDQLLVTDDKNTCPACGSELVLSVSGQYQHSEGVVAPYAEFECELCGYVLHQYLKPGTTPPAFSEGFPF
jgi:transcription elongation factor Elf1